MRNRIDWPLEPAAPGARRTEEWNSQVCSVQRYPRRADADTCARIVELARGYPAEPGRMAAGLGRMRRNVVRWIERDTRSDWLYHLVSAIFVEANRRYGFELSGYAEPLHVVEYGRDDHIGWHLDCTREQTSTRKLVATLHLTDPTGYSGGELDFCALAERLAPPVQGEAIVFPAFLPHRVRRVRHGRRHVLVAWAHGPAFR